LGHVHLGVLPNTVKWRAVVELLDSRAADGRIIAASAEAVERDLRDAAQDRTFVEAVRLLAMIPEAARHQDFGRRLRDLGLPVGDQPTLAELVTATGDWLDRSQTIHKTTTDFAELSRRALLGTLSSVIGADLPGLFSATPQDVRKAAARLATPSRFSPFARAFFTRLLSETLSSYLDRTLSTRVGPGRRFADMGERAAFDAALTQYCMEATRIIRDFAAGWYGKTIHREGEIRTQHAAAFGAVAFKKIGEELRRKRAQGA
jgi:hypothetical protein